MIINIAADGSIRLLEAAEFRRLHISLPATDAARAALPTLGRVEGETHVFIAPERLLALAGEQDAAWESGFRGMIAYAVGKGWADPSGAVRVHIEGVPSA